MTQFLRDQAIDSEEVVTPLMLDGTYLSRNFPDIEGLETWRTAASILLVLVIILFLYLQILVLACLNLSRVNYFFPFLLCFYRHYRNPSVTSLYST